VAFENDDRGRYGRVEPDLRKQSREHFPKLLQLQSDFPDVLLVHISQQEKVFSAHADPRVLRGHGGVLGNDDEKAETDREGENITLHKILWTKDGRLSKTKDVIELRPLSYGLAGFHRRFELDLACGEDGILSQTERKSPHDSDAVDLSVRK